MKVLFIGGTEITIHPNHPARHFLAFLEGVDAQVDVVSMTPFYTGTWPANAWSRFWRGLRESVANPITVFKKRNGVAVDVRRLPSRLDAFIQGMWAYLHLGPLTGEQYDVCFFGNPENVLLPLLLKKMGLIKTIIYNDWDFYPGFERSWFQYRMTTYREHLCVSLADVVISVGSLLAELRKSQGAARTTVIPNGVNYQLFATAQKKKPHPPTLIYTGSLAEDWGIDVSIEGFARIHAQMPEARYLIIGNNGGPYAQYLDSLVSKFGLSNSVFFLGAKRYEEIPYYLAEADIGVALNRPNELRRYAVPLKVVEYMAAGLAIVGTGTGETEKLILDSQCGRCVPFSSDAFASAALDILRDKAVLTSYIEHAREYAKRYDWDSLASGLVDEMNATVLLRDGKAQL